MSRDQYRELRRYALAGDTQKAEKLLQAMLRQDPDDLWAKDERDRLAEGIPLLSGQSHKVYRTALADCLQARLKDIIHVTPANTLHHQTSEKLHELREILARLKAQLEECGRPFPANARQYTAKLRKLLLKRWFRAHRKITYGIIAGIVMVQAAVGGCCYIRQQAEDTADALDEALRNEQWQNVRTLRAAADTGIYHLLHPPVAQAIYRADAWISGKEQCYRLALRRLEPIRKGERSVESFSLSERAAMERELQAIPKGLDDLSPVWEACCRKEQAQLSRLQAEEMARLQAPLPDEPAWKNSPLADLATLQKVLAATEERLKDYQDAVLAYKLNPEVLRPLQQRVEELKAHAAVLESLSAVMTDLCKARTTKEYADILESAGQAGWYPLTQTLEEALQLIPKRNTLRNLMANEGGILPPGFVAQARKTFLKNGPTFSAAHPATSQQVEMMEDLFTTRTLRTVLWEINDADRRFAYTEKEPKLRDWVTFSRCGLDPAYHVGKNQRETWKSNNLRVRRLDTTQIDQAAGLKRDTFFSKVNVPFALERIFLVETKSCPALAKAYVYDHLMRILTVCKDKDLIGFRFAPTMQEDFRSFSELKEDLAVTLAPGCWLEPSPIKQQAEVGFQKWFEDHKGHRYAEEIARNYGEIAAVHAKYAGFVDYDGKLKTIPDIPEGAELWYVERDGHIRHEPVPSAGKAWEKAAPFSPLFIKEKDEP